MNRILFLFGLHNEDGSVLNLLIFRSSDCFSLGWPMRDDGDFFKSTRDLAQVLLQCETLVSLYLFHGSCITEILFQGRKGSKRKSGSTGKSYFIETRTFWHIFRSYDRMWTFYILALQVFIYNSVEFLKQHSLHSCSSTACMNNSFQTGKQAMLIIAFSKVSPLDIFQQDVLKDLSSIFITAAFLRVLQSMTFLHETAILSN